MHLGRGYIARKHKIQLYYIYYSHLLLEGILTSKQVCHKTRHTCLIEYIGSSLTQQNYVLILAASVCQPMAKLLLVAALSCTHIPLKEAGIPAECLGCWCNGQPYKCFKSHAKIKKAECKRQLLLLMENVYIGHTICLRAP